MIIEEVNEQLLRLFWGFKTLTLDTSPFTASTSKRTTPERWIDRESSSYSTTEREERRRWRNRPSSPVGHPVGLQSDGDGLWWLSSYRKREAEESKDRETRGHTAPTQSTASTVVLGSPVTVPTLNSRVPGG
ncbi:hypothetical protein HanHA300_Chr10g0355481 [Helianthus annuus]|nr:hypothetical protein HanHA300_Chr10g0355481 [Helianthus annuus]KAJ0529371.1 hypothetical protein HanHA89_Chr10g0377071 [Helianthus annuus]KAJ0696258.1 hypothetical protein HanLR1_Chr10g0354981 [Helianthus annuus]